jgi:hypothetical protein
LSPRALGWSVRTRRTGVKMADHAEGAIPAERLAPAAGVIGLVSGFDQVAGDD